MRQREYRARNELKIKMDNKLFMRKSRLLKKYTSTEIEKKAMRDKETKRKALFRAKQALKQDLVPKIAFKTPQSFGKAVKKLEKYLPSSPTKKNELLKTILEKSTKVEAGEQTLMKNYHKLSADILKEVNITYNSIQYTYVSQNKKDVMRVKLENGKMELFPVRYLVM